MEQSDNKPELSYNPNLSPELMRLHQVTVWGRWLVVVCLWLTVGLLSLWGLRGEMALWMQYFTWAAVRYGLAYNPIPAFGLALCIGLTVATLVWQSRNILLGLPVPEKQRLEQQVHRIRQQGPTHPLWQWVYGDRATPSK
jgi:hypothetical protein